jgi:very-short-patch-repair endonuclease
MQKGSHRLGVEVHRWNKRREDPWLTPTAWQRILPAEMVFVGATSAWLLGLDFEPTNPVEVAVPKFYGHRSRAGLMVRRDKIPPTEVVTKRGLRAAGLLRTLCQLCLRWPALEALVAIDMALHKGLTSAPTLQMEGGRHRPGAGRLRSLAQFAAPAESPMETRLRWLLIEARLPRPEVQTSLRDGAARFVGRADLYYPQANLVLEYDGGNHRERLVEDDQRQNLLVNAGYQVLRFTAADIYKHADVTVAQVRAALEPKKAHSANYRRSPAPFAPFG